VVTDARRRHVLIVPAWYPTEERPFDGTFVREQALAVAETNDVTVFADGGFRTDGTSRSLVRESRDGPLRVVTLTYPRTRRPLATAVTYVRALSRTIRSFSVAGSPPDVLHAHVYHAGVAALVTGRRWRLPVVVSEHSSHFLLGTLPPLARRRAALVFRYADRVCPVSAALLDAIRAAGMRGRFEVVPNVIDDQQFHPRVDPAADGGSATILVVAGLQPVKGVDRLIAALPEVVRRRTDFRVQIIGDGPERGEYERLVERLGVSRYVDFLGSQPAAAVAAAMREAAFLVAPSVTETFGVVLAEGLMSGRPVVAARVGAVPEIVDASTGILVPPDDRTALADAIDEMLDRHGAYDPALLRHGVKSRFGRAAVAARWNRIYDEVSAARRQ
jgi:L-malate glycosyltransferase